jgi:hypothetical protein
MKKIVISLVAATALAGIVTPAMAAPHGGYGGGHGGGYGGGYEAPASQAQELEFRINRSERRGAISHREAARLRYDLRQVERLTFQYRRDGPTRWERADLDRRFNMIQASLRYERNDRDYGYGYGGRYDR